MKHVLSVVVLASILAGCGGSGDEGSSAPTGSPEGTAPSARGSSPQDTGGVETAKEIAGRVVGMEGKPVGGATVFTGEEKATTDSDGRFKIPTR